MRRINQTNPFIQWSESEKEQAKKADYEYVLQTIGEPYKREGNQIRLVKHDSLVISNGKWHWHSRNMGGGNPVDFLMKYKNYTYNKTMETILNTKGIEITNNNHNYSSPSKTKEYANLKIPERNSNSRRVFAYLSKTRCIDPQIISDLMHEKMIYESKLYHNCVFVGKDTDGNIKYIAEKGTLTNVEKAYSGEKEGSDKSFGFEIKGTDDTVCVFESPIDSMSYATLYKAQVYKKTSLISLGSVSPMKLEQFLKDNPNVKNICLCLDNDECGLKAMDKFESKFKESGYNINRHTPDMDNVKDWNEQLMKCTKKCEFGIQMG